MSLESQLEKGLRRPLEPSTNHSSRSSITVIALDESKPIPPSPKTPFQPSNILSLDELALIKPPSKTRISKWVRFQVWFTLYHRFFAFTFALNSVGLILCTTGHWQYPKDYTGAFIVGNLLLSVLVRNELFARFLYLSFNFLFAKWSPLWFRLLLTSTLQHLGGIHSGCAMSGLMWLLYKVVILIIDIAEYHPVILTFGVLTNMAVGISAASAIPKLRDTHHNIFEGYHRLVGWIGLILTWVFTILCDSYDLHTHAFSKTKQVYRQQDFWFCIFMSFFIIFPWLTVRKVEVEVTVPSSKVAILKFKRGMQHGLLARVGHGAVMEYHAFGIVSEGPHADCHYLIAGVQGDFTRSLVEKPPTHLWTRELKFAGVSNTSSLYRRGVRVCTGTGIGAGLSTCIQNENWYLIWMGSDTLKTFGPEIDGLIQKHLVPGRATIWDTKKRGCRPDLMKLILDVCKAWEPECVIITSNLSGSKEMMEGCKQAGYPAFGTLFDF